MLFTQALWSFKHVILSSPGVLSLPPLELFIKSFLIASFADEILFLDCLCNLQVPLTVYLASVVRDLAGVALVESAFLHDILSWRLSKPLVCRIC